jgi:hypothetical protein
MKGDGGEQGENSETLLKMNSLLNVESGCRRRGVKKIEVIAS